MGREQLIQLANENAKKLAKQALEGTLVVKGQKVIIDNEKTLKALQQPVTKLMRPMKDVELDQEGHKLVRVHIYGQGFTQVAACREVLPERKSI